MRKIMERKEIMDMKEVTIDEALGFVRKAEKAYRDDHGIDFYGMRYGFNDALGYGWAIPEEKFKGDYFRNKFRDVHDILHFSDGSTVDRDSDDFYNGPVTLISPLADRYQYDTVHELGHQVFKRRFTLSHKPMPRKVNLPGKVCLTVSDGISEHMCCEEMLRMMDANNRQYVTGKLRKYENLLNESSEFEMNGFDTWREVLSHSVSMNGPDFRHAVGLNFVLTTFNYGTKLSQYLDLLAEHPPTEEHILDPVKYRNEIR